MVTKKNIALIFFLLSGCCARAQIKPADTASKVGPDSILSRIVLIGDAGQLNTDGKHHVVDAIREWIKLDSLTTVLFMGDNLYTNGLPDVEVGTYQASKAILDSQISVVNGTKAQLYMIPGNHDWENGGRGGYNAIIREQLYVSFINNNPRVHFVPEDGCPGPIEVNVGNDVTLILFDSQWWLHGYDKPEIESDCDCKTTDELVTRIGDIAANNSKKLVILSCHHPFKSNGIHGGFFTLKQHIFPFTDIMKKLYLPLPVIGSIYPISRSVFGSPQDLKYPAYQNMISEISTEIKRFAPNLIFASGHDHNMQLIKDSSYYYIVSGGGSKQARTSKNRKSLFNETAEGFCVIEVTKNKDVWATYYTVTDSVRKYPAFFLMNFTEPVQPVDSTKQAPAPDPFAKYKDTVTQAITDEFYEIKGLRKLFMGANYRKEWGTPVNMRVFNLGKERGGFRITGMGGGKQTQTLQLKNLKTKEDWVLRTVDKNPSQTIPEAVRGSMASDLLQELKSASMPYGALIVPPLTDAIGVSGPKPELFFVPDDPALGFYQSIFANKVCMLERKDASFDGSNTIKSGDVFNKMITDNDHRSYQPDVLRARLLDMVIGDYDRGLDQWRWDKQDTGKGKIYAPVPRDRDQAFFYSDGALIRFLSGRQLPFLKGFRPSIPKVNWFNYAARDFDRLYLTDLDESEWVKAVSEVQSALPDSIIRKAVMRLPKEIYPIHGEDMIRKMISRRDYLAKAATGYYRFISKKVNVVGSNLKEYFKVTGAGDGKLQVKVYARARNTDTSFVMYDRIFDPKVTKEIRLFGLNDKDYFDVEENAVSTIKLRIIGGQENDTFDIKGKVEALLYDIKDTNNYIKNNSHAKNRFSTDPLVNERSIFGFNYDYSKFPRVHLNYNSDDGLILGAGFSRRTYGFRNQPYASDNNISALYSLTHKAIQLQYRGEFNHITRNIDVLVNSNYSAPALQNFFGWGNNTHRQQGHDFNYYQIRYNSFEFEALFRQRLYEKFHAMLGPYFYSYSASYDKNINNAFAKPREVGLDSADIFSKKSYLGAKMVLLVDNRNSDFFPTRGIYWVTDFTALAGMKSGSNKYMALTSDMTIYASLSLPAKLVAILKIGGGRIFTRNFEYFQALSLGSNLGLNGFRKNRYTGRILTYGSLELKYKIADINSYIIPGTLGVSVFGDAGRVRYENDGSQKWRTAYGFGLYYLPFNLFAINVTAGFNAGEKMLTFSLGTKINLSY